MRTAHLKVSAAASFLLLISCKNKEDAPDPAGPEVRSYVHISHTRTDQNPDLEPVTSAVDFSGFDMRWLGGDMAFATSADTATLENVDEVFDLKNPNTLWTLGNHDYPHLPLIEHFTGRPNFYAFSKNGLCVLVLDTQADACNISGGQLALLENVTDTIASASHLILLHHKMVWMLGQPELEAMAAEVSNGEPGTCAYCLNPNNFYDEVYPKLLEVEARGIEVICIGGDIGRQVPAFEHQTAEGIDFLASGIQHGKTGNQALIFTHDLDEKSLTWTFRLLADF